MLFLEPKIALSWWFSIILNLFWNSSNNSALFHFLILISFLAYFCIIFARLRFKKSLDKLKPDFSIGFYVVAHYHKDHLK